MQNGNMQLYAGICTVNIIYNNMQIYAIRQICKNMQLKICKNMHKICNKYANHMQIYANINMHIYARICKMEICNYMLVYAL